VHVCRFCRTAEDKYLVRGKLRFCIYLVRPEAIACGANSSFSPDVFLYFFSEREISEMRGLTGVKFCMMVSTRPNFIMPVQNFGRHTPKKFQGPKTCKILPDFGRLRSSAANISETDENIQNRINMLFYRDSSRVRRNKSGEVWSSNLGDLDVELYPPKVHFSEDHISAPRGCCAPKFLHTLENDQVLLAHPPPGTGAHLTTFFRRGSKIGLKCNKGALITSELGGVARRNFGMWHVSRLGC